VDGQNDGAALAWLDRGRPEEMPDWALIALDARSLSVETANRFADMAPMRTLMEAGEVRTALRGAPAEGEDPLPALNERPGPLVTRSAGGEPRVEVLGWGLWADRAQRHLVFGLMQGYYRYNGMLGMPGEGRAYAERVREQFGRLDLYPLVLRLQAHDADSYRTAMAACRELALRSPERVTAGHWDLIRAKMSFAPVPGDLPDESTWFRPPLPSGTLLDAGWRIRALPAARAIAAKDLAALRELAPHDAALAVLAADRQPGLQRSAAALAAIYGPLAEFHVRIMGKLADAAWYDTDQFRTRQGALCDLLPDYCFLLGHRLAELGLADEAAIAYRKGIDGATNRVRAANQSRWLVDYYFDHGRTREAERIAHEAAGTYSSRGLFVMARLAERRSLAEAEEHYRRILDRYEQAAELAGFYYRQARVEKKAAYEARFRETLALALPAGLEPLDRASLTAPPVDGVLVKEENDNTKKCGIKWGHVIVGLDGIRVRDMRAYGVVRALSQSPLMKLVVWRAKATTMRRWSLGPGFRSGEASPRCGTVARWARSEWRVLRSRPVREAVVTGVVLGIVFGRQRLPGSAGRDDGLGVDPAAVMTVAASALPVTRRRMVVAMRTVSWTTNSLPFSKAGEASRPGRSRNHRDGPVSSGRL
jgi:tetratricopeptide (TPR) repeat protein